MRKEKEEWLGWHFLPDDGCMRWGTKEKVVTGKKYTMYGDIKLCERGFHASKKTLDALSYAPGGLVCRVRLSGHIIEDTDKAVATEREVIAMADATKILHEFSCWCAEQALERERQKGREPDERSWGAIRVKREWLDGKATDKDLAAARDAAWDAAWAAARDAAWDAARDAARAAARDAAWAVARAAARDAAWAAAWDAAWAAARDAAWDAQEEHLTSKLNSLLGIGS